MTTTIPRLGLVPILTREGQGIEGEVPTSIDNSTSTGRCHHRHVGESIILNHHRSSSSKSGGTTTSSTPPSPSFSKLDADNILIDKKDVNDDNDDDDNDVGTTATTVTSVTLGRKEILHSLWSACGCINNGNAEEQQEEESEGDATNQNDTINHAVKKCCATGGDGVGTVISTKNKCQYCTRIGMWAVYALSRKMLRFTTTTTTTSTSLRSSTDMSVRTELQFRGNHARVLWNGIEQQHQQQHHMKGVTTKDCHEQRNDEEKEAEDEQLQKPLRLHDDREVDGWNCTKISVKPNDILSLKPKKGEGLLEFRVVTMVDDDDNDNNNNENDEGQYVQEVVSPQAAGTTNHPAMEEARSQKDDIDKNGEIQREDQTGQPQQPSEDQHEQSLVDDQQQSTDQQQLQDEGEAHRAMEGSKQEQNNPTSISSMVRESIVIDNGDDNSTHGDNDQGGTTTVTSTLAVAAATTAFATAATARNKTTAIYFLPYGLASSRRSKLIRGITNLGGTVVDNIMDANIIVISGTVKELTHVVTRSLSTRKGRIAGLLNIEEEENLLRDHLLQGKDVYCVLPSWADKCISDGNLLVNPSRVHLWPGLPTNTVTTAPVVADNGFTGNATKRKVDASTIGTCSNGAEVDDATAGGATKRPRLRQHRYAINVKVAEIFKTLSNLHQSMPLLEVDQWKAYCFRIVSGRLLNLDFEVSNDPDTIQRLRLIKGFGKSVVDKIIEYLETGTLQRIVEFQTDPQRCALKNLTAIWGVGRVTALELMKQGYNDIVDVRQGIVKNKIHLDRNQLVGVECYEDILERMDRTEVEMIAQIVRTVAEKIFPNIEVSIMGSYRRGKETCGDVDIHLVHPSYEVEIPPDALGQIIDALWTTGKIAFHLTFLFGMMTGSSYEDYENASRNVPSKAWRLTKRVPFTSSTSEHSAFYMGCLYSPVHPKTRRRVDIKFYPYRERIFATVYFTGNGYFNRSMRLWATRKFNCKLNDHGLYQRGDDTTRMMEAADEKDIFDYLKLVYKKPEERDNWDALEPMDPADNVVEIQEMTKSQLADETNLWVE